MPTEYGSAAYKGHRPASDASTVTMLRRAGAVVLGKTVTTEFAHQQTGKTRNPHNLEHTPGGSSSGSAAAVAAGMVPIATGSQTAGSVIRPAAYCGVAGFKPSYKLLPTIGVKCYAWSLDTVGLYGAGVADVAFATAAMSGRDLRVDRASPAAPRVALVRTHIWADASADMQNAVETTARALETAGASMKDVTLPPLLEDAWRAHKVIILFEAARSYAFEYDHKRDLLGPKTRDMLDEAGNVGVDAYDDARRTAKRARLALADLMGAIRRDPDALGTGRRAARHRRDRRRELQLAVDADGHAVRERAGTRGPLGTAARRADRRALRPRPRRARSRAVHRTGAGATLTALRSCPRKRESKSQELKKNWVPAFAGTSGAGLMSSHCRSCPRKRASSLWLTRLVSAALRIVASRRSWAEPLRRAGVVRLPGNPIRGSAMTIKQIYDKVFTEYPGHVGYAPAAVAIAVCVAIAATLAIGGYHVGREAIATLGVEAGNS